MKLLAVLPFFLARALAVTQHLTLDIKNVNVAPDGFSRSIVSANGTFPGPLIKAQKGDTLIIQMNNQLTDNSMRRSTTIDFDGLFFDGDNVFNSGTPWVSTCPIGPNASYTYTIPLHDQTGTYWYHSQLGMQYADGLRGPLIIYDPDDPQKDMYDFDDEETIWFISDWWHVSTTPMLQSYINTHIIPVAASTLFNGKGRYNGGEEVEFDVTTVVPGKRYRFRIINASARHDYQVSIDGVRVPARQKHNMTVIGVDGFPIEPWVSNSFNMLAGQRYDVVVTADQPVGNYWINTFLGGGDPARNPELNVTFGRGILHYEGAPDAEPTGPMTEGPQGDAVIPLNDWELVPLVPETPPPFDVEFNFVTSRTPGLAEWNINNISYVEPGIPTLVRIFDQDVVGQGDLGQKENTFVLPKNKVVQINFPPSVEDELHRSNYWVIKHNDNEKVNEVNPIKRDVSGAGLGGMTLRFRTDKVGPWFFHCHIFWHMWAGLGAVMLVDPPAVLDEVHPTPEWDSLCDTYRSLPPEQQ
ncbi:Laccase 2 [Mycena kentingensis (nom. inval.)]|nr:Laccase 2 [Mycena kentingensis (nom. inval.)]